MLSDNESTGYQALAQFLKGPLIKTQTLTVLYPGSGERLEHITTIAPLIAEYEHLVVILVDPLLNETVLRKKCAAHPEIDVRAYAEPFGAHHVPLTLTVYFERAFDIIRDPDVFSRVVQTLPPNGLVISDALIDHDSLCRLSLPQTTRSIGFYPSFGIYRKRA